ncbi:hypothetical protein C807_03058 [Lachnospiraceae bacterium 28-4]|nr:hypothetical protein C807_03058 [Lachnospiraceae bacterium 28-4]
MTEKSFMTVEEVAAELRVSKSKSLSDCKGTERRNAETGLSDRGRTCERYIFS